MPAELIITGVEEAAKRIADLPRLIRRRLRATFMAEGPGLLSQARASYYAVGLRRQSGSLIASLSFKAWAGKETAGVRVFSDGSAFYSGWIEHGLPLRPRHERAMSRRLGIVNRYLGRARAGHKPWGIKARPFLGNTLAAARPALEASAIAAVDQGVADFNAGVLP
jgi:hypothetical protein